MAERKGCHSDESTNEATTTYRFRVFGLAGLVNSKRYLAFLAIPKTEVLVESTKTFLSIPGCRVLAATRAATKPTVQRGGVGLVMPEKGGAEQQHGGSNGRARWRCTGCPSSSPRTRAEAGGQRKRRLAVKQVQCAAELDEFRRGRQGCRVGRVWMEAARTCSRLTAGEMVKVLQQRRTYEEEEGGGHGVAKAGAGQPGTAGLVSMGAPAPAEDDDDRPVRRGGSKRKRDERKREAMDRA
ncbi:hypothetical protein TRIUR3_28206 [Triticum urartu]|uniref:Uncharacterized protein n=1 Tax=Triticum urartu TaxID=4572 RepID=M7Z273_TRIUA|nr:hypothetical protein TRIUR3_28206 [Triticum urartu]